MCEDYFYNSWLKGKKCKSRGMGNFGEGRDFFIGWWQSVKEWFWPFKLFSKPKTPFRKYWTSIKLKSAWSVWNKMETVQQQRLQLKMKFLLGYNKKIVDLRGRGGGGSWWRKTIQGLCAWWNFNEVNFCN